MCQRCDNTRKTRPPKLVRCKALDCGDSRLGKVDAIGTRDRGCGAGDLDGRRLSTARAVERVTARNRLRRSLVDVSHIR